MSVDLRILCRIAAHTAHIFVSASLVLIASNTALGARWKFSEFNVLRRSKEPLVVRKELKGLVGIEELIPSHRFDGLSTKDVQNFTHGRDLSSQAWQGQLRKAWKRERRHPEGSASLTLGFGQRVHGRASPANWFERFLAARTNYHTAQGAHQILTKYEDPMLRGQIVVDLGPGPTATLYDTIKLSGAAAYIAVEPYFTEDLGSSIALAAGPDDTPAAVSSLDMLAFLKKIPPASVTVLASGIDASILNQRYASRVIRQINRVVSKGAMLIGVGTVPSILGGTQLGKSRPDLKPVHVVREADDPDEGINVYFLTRKLKQ